MDKLRHRDCVTRTLDSESKISNFSDLNVSLSQKSLIKNSALNRIDDTMHTQQIAELITEGFSETNPHCGNVALNLVDDIGEERAIEWAVEEGKSKLAPGGLRLRITKDRPSSRQKLRVFGRKGNNDQRHKAVTLLTYDRLVREASQAGRRSGEGVPCGRSAAADCGCRAGAEAAGQPQRKRQVERRRQEMHDK